MEKGHVYNISLMQFSTDISRITHSKSYMLSLTESIWKFRNDELWDTHYHALLKLITDIHVYVIVLNLHSTG